MTRTNKSLVALMAALAPLSFAAAQDLDAGRRCAQVADSLQRLVCYDGVFRNAAAAPASAAVPAVAAPAATAAVAAPALGDEHVKKPDMEKKKSAEQIRLTAVATEVRQMYNNMARVTLDNGQVWDQQDISVLFSIVSGDTVRIEKGRMGGYRMGKDDKSSGWVRVTRVK
jgi:hypothetical protein